MALANFFDKAALGAAQVLNNFNRKNFEQVLLTTTVEIIFDDNACSTREGQVTLDLLIRVLARLYPNLKLSNLNKENIQHVQVLKALALSINPVITLSNLEATVSIVVGATKPVLTDHPIFYIGSKNWTAYFSTSGPVKSSDCNNPFGGGVAACFGAANIFREVFKSQLPFGKLDEDFSISAFSFLKNTDPNLDPLIATESFIQDTTLVGIGAIGNGALWALNKIQNLSGQLDIVDHEKIALSNLQRYLLADQSSIGLSKVEWGAKFFKSSVLNVHEMPMTWSEYLQQKNCWKLRRVAIGVDSAEDRIAIQGALPEKIFNAWTQPEAIGISRHLDFLNTPCLTCLYIPDAKRKSLSEVVAENLGLSGTEYERLVRGYLAMEKPVDEQLIGLIAAAKGIDPELLREFTGKNINIFYSEVVCGGVLMKLAGGSVETSANIQVPAAFESAMAGILLAAEIFIESNGLQRNLPVVTRFNLLRSVNDYIIETKQKHHSGRCICQDKTYQDVYRRKYSSLAVIK